MHGRVYWRVEGSLLDLTTVQPVAFFTWNAQTFIARMARRGLVFLMAALRPFLYAAHRVLATRVVHSVLRGVSRDRLDLLGDEYFQYKLKPYLKPDGVARLKHLQAEGADLVLVSQGLDHVMRPLARFLGVRWLVSNRLDFRDRVATGRLLAPVIRPRGLFARITGTGPDGQRTPHRLVRELDLPDAAVLDSAVFPVERPVPPVERPIVHFDHHRNRQPLSVRSALAGRHVMLIGFTGFIGKVWLVNTLLDLPEVSRIYLLIRRQKSNPATRRFERIVEESPVFDPLFAKYGSDLASFLREKVEVVEGDVSVAGLGLDPDVASRLQERLDVIINSSGLTDFNPELRDALAINVDAAVHVMDFVRQSDHCGLVHLSTCYVAGARDGRVSEKLRLNYTPAGIADFDAEREWQSLHEVVRQAEAKAESSEVTRELQRLALDKEHAARDLQGAALENQIRKGRIRWLRNYLTEAGTQSRAGTRLAQHLHPDQESGRVAHRQARRGTAHRGGASGDCGDLGGQTLRGLERGHQHFSFAFLFTGTNFRQLPSNERKRLDIIPVDSVCHGITLISAALIERRHEAVYQLATSVTNPCDMGRSIELTSLAHRKHYRAQEGLESWLRLRMDAIPVSKDPLQPHVGAGPNGHREIDSEDYGAPALKKPPFARAERNLEKVGKLVAAVRTFHLAQ